MATQTWRHTRPHQQVDVIKVVDVYTWQPDIEGAPLITTVEDDSYRTNLVAGETVADVLDRHYGPRPSPDYRTDGTIDRHEWTCD